MTKQTMIWQALSMIIAGKVANKNLFSTQEEFEKAIINDAKTILAYSEEDIRNVLYTTNCTEFAEILANLFGNKQTNIQ